MNTCTVCLRDFQPAMAVSALGHDVCIAVEQLMEDLRKLERLKDEEEMREDEEQLEEPPLEEEEPQTLFDTERSCLRQIIYG